MAPFCAPKCTAAIYLVDTTGARAFSRDPGTKLARADTEGCVRVEDCAAVSQLYCMLYLSSLLNNHFSLKGSYSERATTASALAPHGPKSKYYSYSFRRKRTHSQHTTSTSASRRKIKHQHGTFRSVVCVRVPRAPC